VGLWSGLMPRLVGEVSLVAIASATTFLLNTYVVHDREVQKYTHQFANFVGQSLTYPFQVSSAWVFFFGRGGGVVSGRFCLSDFLWGGGGCFGTPYP
jgi:hypothetical protein